MPENNDVNEAAAGDARSTESFAAEFQRKTEKLGQENAALSQKLDQLTNMMQRQQQQAAPTRQGVDYTSLTEEQLEEMSYNKPKEYARAVDARATAKAEALVDKRMNAQQQVGNVMTQLISDYPELGDQSSDLSKRAVDIYAGLPNSIKNDPMSYKIAVRDAAAELGMLTKTKRKDNNSDNFSLNSNSGNTMTVGNSYKVGRFKLTSSANWVANSSPDFSLT